jgi:hypothetical protein
MNFFLNFFEISKCQILGKFKKRPPWRTGSIMTLCDKCPFYSGYSGGVGSRDRNPDFPKLNLDDNRKNASVIGFKLYKLGYRVFGFELGVSVVPTLN